MGVLEPLRCHSITHQISKLDALLQVRDLTVRYDQDGQQEITAVRGVSFDISPGEILGLLGESGCGKTTLARALLHLLPEHSRIIQGSVRLRGRELLGLKEREMRTIRGAEVSLIPQDPGIALNPCMRVGYQLAEVVRAHRPWNRNRCFEEATALLARVRLDDTARIFEAYPHELSGGERHRVVIAQALACSPALVVADESTASLDSTTQAEILSLFRELKTEREMSWLLITHSPRILSGLADRVLVMYAGRIVEAGSSDEILSAPLHPYTQGLLACLPELPRRGDGETRKYLASIPGRAPDPGCLPAGCSFAPRCPVRVEVCSVQAPPEILTEGSGLVECHLYDR
jgi:oligopeptide/dipeptide ABC transporter ATP-binding protein